MQGKRGVIVGKLRHHASCHPLFVAALWIVLAFSLGRISPWFIPLVLTIAAVAGHRASGWKTAVLWTLLVTTALGIGHWRNASDVRLAADLGRQATAIHVGRVIGQPRGDEGFWQAPVRLEEHGTKVWWQGRGEVPVEGSRVQGMGRFEWAEAPRNPGEFDRRRWMEQQGLITVFRQQPQRQSEVSTGWWPRWMASLRADFRSSITRGLEQDSEGARVIRAVVMGEKPRDDAELLEDFRHSGSMHVFSVSGLHVGMVAVLVWMIAACTGLSRRWLVLPVIGVVFGYALLTGANPPAVRAAWMATVFLGAFCFRRRPDLSNSLGAVLLVLLVWDVRQLLQPSVQLSYGVVAAIAFGLPWTTRWFGRWAAAPLHMPVAEITGPRLWWWRLRQWSATTLAVSCAACIGATPLTLWHFGLVTPVSAIAALLMLPLVFGVMALAMVSVILSPIPMANVPVNRVNGLRAGGCAKVAGIMAEVPGGHLRAGREVGPALWILDLEQGDGAACWIPDKNAAGVLIDCGGRSSFRHPLLASLNDLGIEPDSMLLTHPDGGHVGGGHAVWRELSIRQVLMPVEQARSPAYRAWLKQAPTNGVKLLQAMDLQGLPMGEGARIEWLHLPDARSQNLTADHRVLVMRLHWKGWKILWLSDAGMVAEQAMLESGHDLTADVIVAGRHRSDLCLTDAFVEAVAPKVIIIGNDQHPEGERVSTRQLQQWREAGIAVFDQSECGAVSLRPEGEALRIEGFVSGRELRLK